MTDNSVALDTVGDSARSENKRYQQEIKRKFRKSISARVFQLLLQYDSLSMDQIQALIGVQAYKCNKKEDSVVHELRECGYLEVHTKNRFRVYRLSDTAFLNPETDRRDPNDIDDEELIAAVFGVRKDGAGRGRRRCRQKQTNEETFETTQNVRKKQKVARNDDTPSSRSVKNTNAAKKVTKSTNLSKSRSSEPTHSIFQNNDILGKIGDFLDAESLLFSTAAISKDVRFQITYEHAMRCVMATQKGKRRMKQLRGLIKKCCIYTPSPMRILRLGNGRRCECCNMTRTNDLNDLGLFLCKQCTMKTVVEAGSFRNIVRDEKCAKIERNSNQNKQIFIYARNTPFKDRAGEISGPYAFYGNLAAAFDAKTDLIVNDENKPKIQSILESYEKFQQRDKKWNHCGIVTHSTKFSGTKVLIQWKNGERTWQPLGRFAEDDFETCAVYAREHNLLDEPGWKRFRRDEITSP